MADVTFICEGYKTKFCSHRMPRKFGYHCHRQCSCSASHSFEHLNSISAASTSIWPALASVSFGTHAHLTTHCSLRYLLWSLAYTHDSSLTAKCSRTTTLCKTITVPTPSGMYDHVLSMSCHTPLSHFCRCWFHLIVSRQRQKET